MNSFWGVFAAGVTAALSALLVSEGVGAIRGAGHFDSEGFQYLLTAVISGGISWILLLALWLAFWFAVVRPRRRTAA